MKKEHSDTPASVPRLGIEDYLEEMRQTGGFAVGEVRVPSDLRLHHRKNSVDDPGLEVFHSPSDARKIALYNETGKYRPLKSAPNLRSGWRLDLRSISELRLALDALYPAAIGMWLAFLREELEPTAWRDTLARQTGMYRIVQKITDEQSEILFRKVCNRENGCLRRILWNREGSTPHGMTCTEPGALRSLSREREIPILCSEACNLLVAEGRKVVKGEAPTGESA